jgi:glycosyltransferase involved in cell wall biosynthesis
MQRQPNVLIMVDSFDMGGAESQTVLLTRLMLQSGRYGVHLACLRREGILLGEAEALGLSEIPEYRLTSFYDWNMLVQLRRFISFLRQHKIDVVHPQSFYTNVFGLLGAALARVPVRIAFRGDTGGWRTVNQDVVERWSYRLAHAVHANSEAVRDFLIEFGVPSRQIVTVHNGLDMSRVTPRPDARREEILAQLGLPRDDGLLFVTIVANMRNEIKDHRMFLRAAAQIHKEVPKAAFVLAGEGELLEQMRALAEELGVGSNTYFIGRCASIAELLFISDICVLSSKAEGFSNSILEYMAAARPVVATDVGGAREAVKHGETGYLVRSGDDKAMAAHITSLLRDPALARAMGSAGRLVVEEKFSDRAQLENTGAMYDRLLARGRLARFHTLEEGRRHGS